MKLCLSICFAIILLSCENKDTKKQGHFSENYLNLSDSLKLHLETGMHGLKNNVGIEDSLSSDVYLVSVGFILENDNKHTFVLELNNDITNEIVSKYTFGIEFHLLEKDKEKLSPYAKSKERLFDLKPFKSDLYVVDEYRYVISNMSVPEVQDIDKILFYLYPESGYKGKVLGKKLELFDYKL